MKKAIVLMLAVLLVGMVGTAQTRFFDTIYVDTAAIFAGTISFAGTTITLSPTTSFAVYSPLIYLGYDAGARMLFDIDDTTGDVVITMTGSNKSVHWTVPAGFTLAGNLTVEGTTTTIDTVNLTVTDKNIILANVQTPSDTTADGGGFTLKGATDKTIIWDNTNDNWTYNQHINLESSFVYKVNNVSVLSATTLGGAVLASSLTSVGTIGTGTWQGSVVDHERGGLELDVSLFDGLVRITGGSTVVQTVSSDMLAFLGAATDSAARTELGVKIGEDVQAWDTDLDTWATLTPTVDAKTLVESTNFLSMTQDLSVEIGVDVQAWDAQLDDIAALVQSNSYVIVGDDTNWVQETGDTLRTSLGLAINTNVQAWDAQLDDIAALVQSDSYIIVGDDTNWVQETGGTLRTSLGLAIDSDVQAHSADLDTIAAAATTATNEGVVFISQFTIAYTQTASYTVCTIPANADITKVEVVTTTAFTGGSSTTIDIGWSGNTNKYASALVIGTAGFATGDEYGDLGDVGGSNRDVLAQITTDDSAGACTVYVYWTMGTPGTP